MSRAFAFIGLALIVLYAAVIGMVAAGAKLDRGAVIVYLVQLIVWVSLAIFWQSRATKKEQDRDWRR